jgi:hypothetical protein
MWQGMHPDDEDREQPGTRVIYCSSACHRVVLEICKFMQSLTTFTVKSAALHASTGVCLCYLVAPYVQLLLCE